MCLLYLTARYSKEIVTNDETNTTETSSDPISNIKESNIKLDVFEGKNRRIKTDRRMPWSPLRQEGRRISDGAEDQINDDSELHG
ncbi:MAG: hypothetical protein JKY67_22385 [Pseudomonadales bacterium]|nr:hypothetical protein [Pseudomonadales bacterium]